MHLALFAPFAPCTICTVRYLHLALFCTLHLSSTYLLHERTPSVTHPGTRNVAAHSHIRDRGMLDPRFQIVVEV
ncbi:hypothetical protein B0T24DRAFT_303338 [Lasiosphaeria ovina]|uniref:Secreted protein n=1 Tax=Lasiosphaeria ovina TaxID=92902 RepID=A0AAE0K6I9_9PEZI|nr:hypothetical protein B0T24DRAFT_303338 [Lasiosphaeria ovina]